MASDYTVGDLVAEFLAQCGLIEARFSGSSVLHIAGQTATKFVDRDVGSARAPPCISCSILASP